MFKASKWMRTLRAKTQYHEAAFEVTSHKDIQGTSLLWLRIRTYDNVKGPEWEYLVMSKDVAQAIADRLTSVANGLPD